MFIPPDDCDPLPHPENHLIIEDPPPVSSQLFSLPELSTSPVMLMLPSAA